MADTCPICTTNSTMARYNLPQDNGYKVGCPRCGEYHISDSCYGEIYRAFTMEPPQVRVYAAKEYSAACNNLEDLYIAVATNGIVQSRSVISYVLRKRMSTNTIWPVDIVNILKNTSLPTPAELANNLIMFLGEKLSSPGDEFKVPLKNEPEGIDNIYGLLGLKIGNELRDIHFIITSLGEQNILNIDYFNKGKTTARGKPIPEGISLTLLGWQKYEQLKHSVKDSRKTFVSIATPEIPYANALRLLQAIYERTLGKEQPIFVEELKEEIGLSDEDAKAAWRYLRDKRLIDTFSIPYTARINAHGIDRIETARLRPDEPAKDFPSVTYNYIIVQNMVGSSIQQGGAHSIMTQKKEK